MNCTMLTPSQVFTYPELLQILMSLDSLAPSHMLIFELSLINFSQANGWTMHRAAARL